MNITKIKNAYIKNKPSYNYQIKDDQGNLIAKGHLLSIRQKQEIFKLVSTNVLEDGIVDTKIQSYSQYMTK